MWYLKDKGFILLCKYQKAIIVNVIITIHLNEILKENSNFFHSTPWCSWYRSTYVQCIVLFPKLLHVCTMVSNTFLMSILFQNDSIYRFWIYYCHFSWVMAFLYRFLCVIQIPTITDWCMYVLKVSLLGVDSLWGLFRQIGVHSSRFVLFSSFWRL